ncbi:MAG TPA: cupin domain-containing protein [Blastocatellia bacterium]|jgi:anti-sigma factor ChrR (cupin superfamily)|nr:cupin domain-containing protein [Blastocatellia bacterium]
MSHDRADDQICEQAALYALGALEAAEAEAFAEHLAGGCEVCAAEWRACQSVVARLGLGGQALDPPPGVRDRLLASVRTASVTVRAEEGKWRPAGEGLFTKRLFVDRDRGTVTFLLRAQAGARLPAHRHAAVEECLVLEGDYHVNGEKLGPGDYHCALPGSADESLYTEGGATVLLIAPLNSEF